MRDPEELCVDGCEADFPNTALSDTVKKSISFINIYLKINPF